VSIFEVSLVLARAAVLRRKKIIYEQILGLVANTIPFCFRSAVALPISRACDYAGSYLSSTG